jgi:hypothetical protein
VFSQRREGESWVTDRAAEVRFSPVLDRIFKNREPEPTPSWQNRTEPEPNLKVRFRKVRFRFRTEFEPVFQNKQRNFNFFELRAFIQGGTYIHSIIAMSFN